MVKIEFKLQSAYKQKNYRCTLFCICILLAWSEIRKTLQSGVSMEKSKFFNQYSLEVGFPLAMGWPFVYSFEVPTLVSLSGSFNGKIENDQSSQRGQNEKYSLPVRAEINGDAQLM